MKSRAEVARLIRASETPGAMAEVIGQAVAEYEAEIARLRAELDAALEVEEGLGNIIKHEDARTDELEAEIARLRPIKEEARAGRFGACDALVEAVIGVSAVIGEECWCMFIDEDRTNHEPECLALSAALEAARETP